MIELRWPPEPTAPCLRFNYPLKLAPENNSLRIVRMSVIVWIHWEELPFYQQLPSFLSSSTDIEDQAENP
jgi:hypothetical protein